MNFLSVPATEKIDELLYYRQTFDVVELESGRLKLLA